MLSCVGRLEWSLHPLYDVAIIDVVEIVSFEILGGKSNTRNKSRLP